MATSRSSFRGRVDLPGWVFAADQPALAARAIDLSRTGIGLVCAGSRSPAVGEVVRVAVRDPEAGQGQGQGIDRQWSGRVTHSRKATDRVRVGVAFDWPVGPGARSASAVRESPGVVVLGRSEPGNRLGDWAIPALAMAGFAADQISKGWADSTVENPGALASLAGELTLTAPLCAVGALAVAALTFSRFRDSRSPASVAGAGLLGAGLLGNSADRLALGYVRDFLVSGLLPRWSFNLADLFLVAGALALLAGACRTENVEEF